MSAPDGVLEVVERVPARAWRVMAVTAAGVFVVFLDATVVNIAFPALSADFPEANRADLSWVLNAYAVVFGALLVTTGRLADARGRKRSSWPGWSSSGSGPPCAGWPRRWRCWSPPAWRRRSGRRCSCRPRWPCCCRSSPRRVGPGRSGLWGAAGGVAAAVGPTLGALLVEGPGWRWVFLINVPLLVVAVLVGRALLRESTAIATPARSTSWASCW